MSNLFDDAADDARQELGRELINRHALCFKLATMYALDNAVLKGPIEGYRDLCNRILEEAGSLSFAHVGENFFLNQQPIRLDSRSFEGAQNLLRILKRLGVNEIRVDAPLESSEVLELLTVFKEHYGTATADAILEAKFSKIQLRRSEGGTASLDLGPDAALVRGYAVLVCTIEDALASVKEKRGAGMADVRRATQILFDTASGREGLLLALVCAHDSRGQSAPHLAAVTALLVAMARRAGLPKSTLGDVTVAGVLHDHAIDGLPKGIEDPKLRSRYKKAVGRLPVRSILEMLETPVTLRTLERAAIAHEHVIDVQRASEVGGVARLVGVACAYHTLISRSAPGLSVSPDLALRSLVHGSGTRFDADAVALLAATVGLYPPGSWVELTSGDEAVVVESPSSIESILRPKVRITRSSDKARVGTVLDLTKGDAVARCLPAPDDVVRSHFLSGAAGRGR